MSLSSSKNQIDKLGDSLRGSHSPSREDLQRLSTLRLDYDEPMRQVTNRVAEIAPAAAAVVPRLKTVTTIVEKLKRERTRLSTIQDIAGIRVVHDMTLSEQNELVTRIEQAFPGARKVDLRDRPHNGYRAVHVVVEADGCRVEVQVRTEGQNAWAQLMESHTDALGRYIKYDLPPDAPEPVRRLVALMEISSAVTARLERIKDAQALLQVLLDDLQVRTEAVKRMPDAERESALEELKPLMASVKSRQEPIQQETVAVDDDMKAYSEALEEFRLFVDSLPTDDGPEDGD